jgi:hypothetical protein
MKGGDTADWALGEGAVFNFSRLGTSKGSSFLALSLMPRPTALEVTVAPEMASISQAFCLVPCLTTFTALARAFMSPASCTSRASKFFRKASSV